MFNFLRSNSQASKGSDHSDHNVPSPSSHTSPSPATSSFSFINHNSSTDTPSSEPVSGFSFLLNHGDNHHADNEGRSSSIDKASEPVSSFSFINESATTTPAKTESVSSGFSFLSEPVSSTHIENETRPRRDSREEQIQDLKLNKVAVSKQVKKKKKFSRVGLGREDEDDTSTNRRLSATELEAVQEANESTDVHDTASSTTSNTAISSASVIENSAAVQHHEVIAQPIGAIVPVVSTPPNVPEKFVSGVEETENFHSEQEDNKPAESSFNFLSQSITSNPSSVTDQEKKVIVITSSAQGQERNLEKAPPVEVKPIARPFNSILEQFDKVQPPKPTNPPKAPVTEKAENLESSTAITFQVPSSLSSNLYDINISLQNGLAKIRLNYLQSNEVQQSLLQKIDSISAESTQLQEKIHTLEAKQTALAQIEDFEQADSISIEIENTHRELEQKHSDRTLLLQQLQELRHSYAEEKQSLVKEISDSLSHILSACSETKESVDSFTLKLEEFSADETSRLAVEQQRVEMEKSHCDREKQTLLNESQVIEDAIKNQVGDYYQKQEALQSQIATVREEIKVLEEQLLLKRSFEVDLTKSLKQIESKINEARKKFDRQLQRIQERLDTLQKAQKECQEEENLLNQNSSRVHSAIENANKILLEAKTLMQQKLHEKNIVDLVIEDLKIYADKHHTSSSQQLPKIPSIGLESSWEALDILQSNSEAVNPKVKAKRDEIVEVEEQLAKIRGLLVDARIQYDAKVAKQKSLTEQIEQFELAKKLHAANKRFKEAAATAKELKELGEQKEQVEKDIQSLQPTIFEQEELEEAKVSQIEQLQLELQAEQKIEQQQHVQKLSARIIDVKILIRKLQKSSKALQSSSQGTSGIIDESIELYESELQQLLNLRENLSNKCGIEIPDDDIPEEEEEVTAVENIEIEKSPETVIVEEEQEEVGETGNSVITDDTHIQEDSDLAKEETIAAETKEEVIEEKVDAEEEQIKVVEPVAVPEVDVKALLTEIANLEGEMELASDAEDYEKAAELLEVIESKKALLPKEN